MPASTAVISCLEELDSGRSRSEANTACWMLSSSRRNSTREGEGGVSAGLSAEGRAVKAEGSFLVEAIVWAACYTIHGGGTRGSVWVSRPVQGWLQAGRRTGGEQRGFVGWGDGDGVVWDEICRLQVVQVVQVDARVGGSCLFPQTGAKGSQSTNKGTEPSLSVQNRGAWLLPGPC